MPTPIISGTAANQFVTDQATITPFTNVVISDDLGETEDVTVSLSDPASGGLSNLGNGSYDVGTGIFTDTGTAGAVTADLEALLFTPAAGTPGQSVTTGFTISATDTAPATTLDGLTSVVAVAGPAIIGTVTGQTTTNQAPISPFYNVAIADDASQTQTVSVTLSNPANGALSNLGNGSYDAGTGIYSTTGSAANVTNDLEGLVFTPAQGMAGQLITTNFTIADIDTLSLTATDSATSVDTAAGPAISGTAANQAITDLMTIAPFANVVIKDDPSQTETATVTLSNAANGTLGNLGNGTYDATTGIYTITGSITDVTTALQGLVFTPAAGLPGQSVTTTFTINDTDTASIVVVDATTSVVTTAGPTISGTEAGQTVTGQTPIAPFANVVVADSVSQTETLSVTLSDATTGSLGNLGNGSYDALTGVYTTTGSATAVTADLQGLVFTPALGLPAQSVTTTFTISDTDTASATATDATTSVVATSASSTLTIIGTVANQTVTNQASTTPFANVAIADDISQTETVTVTLSAPANGTLGNLGNGSYDAGTGIYTTSGSATNVTNDLEGLVFTPAPGVPGQSVTTSFTISDTNTSSIIETDNATSVTAVAGPAISGTMANQAVSNLTTITPFANVVIVDDISQTETVTVALSDATTGGLSDLGNGSYDPTSGIYTTTGSAADVTTDLRGLIFTPATSNPGQSVTTGFTISDTDTASAMATDVATSVIASGGPSISGTAANQTVTYLTTLTPFANVVIVDDISQTETVTITLSDAATGNLSNLGSGSYDAVTGIYTTTGSATDVTTDLRGLVFTPATGTPGQSITTGFTINDMDTASATATDATTSVIAAGGPVISGTLGNLSVTDQATITPFVSVVIADDISQTETVTVTLSDPNSGGLSNLGSGGYDATAGIYTTIGSAADVTTDLQGIVFTPAAGTPGQSVTTTFTISDTDTSSLTATDTTTSLIAIAGPVISGTAADQAISDQTTIRVFANVVIADDLSQTETVIVTLSDTNAGRLSNLGNGSYDAIAGIYTTTGSATDVTTDLQGLVFTPATGTPGQSVTTTFTISDTDTSSLIATDTTTSVIANAGPVIGGTMANQATTDQTTIAPFASVVIADDISQTETVTVTLSDANAGSLINLGNGSYDATAGSYTTTGSASDVTADLQGLLFTPVAGTPGQSVTTTFTITDIDTATVIATDATTSVITNAGPAISGTTADQPITDQTTIAPFANVVIADDISQTETVTVTLSDANAGSLSNLGNGSYDATAGSYTTTGSAADVTADLEGLVFRPAAGIPGQSVTTTFTITDIDTATVIATDATTSVIATSANPTPTITGTAANQVVTDHTTTRPFAGVMITDDINQTETVTVTLSNAHAGSLSSLGTGSYDPTTGVYTTTGSALDVTAEIQGLVFTPTTGTRGHGVTTNFTIRDIDTASVTATDSVTTVIAIAGPAISGTAPNQSITNQATITPFANVAIADDISQTQTVTVALSIPANGALSHLAHGSYNAVTGIYTTSGSTTAVTTDLHGLVFTPAAGIPGQNVTTGFTITALDTVGTSITDTATSVVAKSTAASNDFDGDGTSDVLFQNNSGLMLNWKISNGAFAASRIIAGSTSDWSEVGTGQFHGNNTSDILFKNNVSGLVLDWQMSNGGLIASTPIAGAAAGWNLIGTGDFNGDGTSDILFQNANSGLVLDWQMLNGAFASSHAIAGATFDWKFIGTGDFDGDGTSDILFQNTNSGLVLDWRMSHGALGQSVAIAGANLDWKVAGIGDFTGSGTSDILFQNSNSGALLYWEISHGTFIRSVSIGTMAAGQSVASIGDYNGDGTSDIMVRSNSGPVIDWQISNGTVSKIQIGGAGSDWNLLK